jgi:outer membrane protein
MTTRHHYTVTIRRATIAAAVAAILAVPAIPTRAETADEITLERAVAIALERNLPLAQSTTRTDLSRASLDQSRASFYPNLSLTAAPSQRYHRTANQATGDVAGQASESLNLSASSSVNLFNGFGDVAALRAAEHDLDASERDVTGTRQSVVLEAATRFIQIGLREELLHIEEENVAAQKMQLQTVQAFHEAGRRPRADVLQQQVVVARADLELLRTRRNLDLATLQLRQTLNLDPRQEANFVTIEPDLPVRQDDYRAAGILSDAVGRPTVEAQRFRIEAAESRVRQARSGRWPSVDLSLGAGTSYSSLNEAYGFSDQFTDTNPSASVGLTLRLPLFDRGMTRSGISRARVQMESERLTLQGLEQAVELAAQQALLDYRTALKQVDVAEVQQTSAREALDAMLARYEAGSATLTELTQARADLVEASGSAAEARYGVLMAHLEVEHSRGNIEQAVAALSAE